MKTGPLEFDSPTIPILYAAKLVTLVEEEGCKVDVILKDCDIKRRSFLEPESKVTTSQLKKLILKLQKVSNNEFLALDLGSHLNFSSHGLSCPNAFQGLSIGFILSAGIEYLKIRFPPVKLELDVTEKYAAITIDVVRALDVIRIFIIEVILSSFKLMCDRYIQIEEIVLDYPMPTYAGNKYNERFTTNIRYDCDSTQIRFEKKSLERLYVPIGQKHEKPVGKHSPSGHIVNQIRAMVGREKDVFISLEQVSDKLDLSPRTCRRQLNAHGYSFKQLRDEVLYSKALRYLQETDMPMEDIAFSLGYSDKANFRRAFRRWSGKPPSAFRKSTKAEAT
ncbi:AraC family transcriptional regulator [Exilibacterium tricleocarpae]|uniref:AraC family transcriptional regulator n=1 Tax=Exilibacterium tricleocarpae TaxID=2591008 RepID=A0A545SNE1_9GAMM|nr:AraC family transcriptional regulator [Exilibacterium tricleocarpae]TQV66510.1 AraC family transcriptional regulator [Exilibacterium tricleocarpae]